MATALVIAVDAMGGDAGPIVTVGGAAIIARRRPDAAFLFYGDEAQVRSALSRHADLASRATIIHTDVAIAMDAKPSQALRQGRRTSSMWRAIQAVKDGEAHVAVSAGNTGALMAMSKFCLKTLRGIDRPAIAAIWPTVASECIVLDVGANVGATSRQLSEFALMGAAMARALFRLERPRVGLLNIGEEEVKGLDQVKAANAWLRESGLAIDHKGFIEGDQIGHGAADVIVTEGFSGNIALKTAEGTARQIAAYLRAAMTRTWLARIGAFLAQGGFAYLKKKMDPRRLNGGVFLGLNGIVIKSHGGTDETGFASALELGYDMAKSGLLEQISTDLERVADVERAVDAPRRDARDVPSSKPANEPGQHTEPPVSTAAS
ncbi:MAG: phosphate acyltransferase PlsX [Pseudomonadota bacterium]